MNGVSKMRVIANVALFIIFIWLIFVFASLVCWLFSPDLRGCHKTGNEQSQTVVQYITTGKVVVPIVTTVTSEEYICKDGRKLWN